MASPAGFGKPEIAPIAPAKPAMNTAATSPSPWIVRFAGMLPTGGSVLDLACGRGRHSRFFLDRGHPVTAIDIDIGGLADLKGDPRLRALRHDLEGSAPWPLGDERFAAVVVTNYLHRPLLPALVAAVAPGGVLLYRTFAQGNEAFGRPRNPDYLLRPGELLEAVVGKLEVVAYEQGRVDDPKPAVRQGICAIRPVD
jgi:SAM-dependent methyltransferase